MQEEKKSQPMREKNRCTNGYSINNLNIDRSIFKSHTPECFYYASFNRDRIRTQYPSAKEKEDRLMKSHRNSGHPDSEYLLAEQFTWMPILFVYRKIERFAQVIKRKPRLNAPTAYVVAGRCAFSNGQRKRRRLRRWRLSCKSNN